MPSLVEAPSASFGAFFASFILAIPVCLPLAEIAGIWTTAGAQIDWAYMLSPPKWAPFVSYLTGWWTITGYLLLTVGGEAIVPQGIIGVAILNNPSYITQPTHIPAVG